MKESELFLFDYKREFQRETVQKMNNCFYEKDKKCLAILKLKFF